MWRATFLVLIILFLPGIPLAAETLVDLQFKLNEHLLTGQMQTGNPAASYRLHPRAELESVSVTGTKIPYRLTLGQLELNSPVPRGDLEIRWSLRLPPAGTLAAAHDEDPSYGVDAAIGPEGVYLSGFSGWLPTPDDRPVSYDVRMTLPDGYLGICGDDLIGRKSGRGTTTLHWRTSRPQAGLALAAGRWQMQQTSVGQVPVRVFLSEQNMPLAATYLQAAADDLQFYQKRFGPYPFRGFSVVENFLPTGYGMPGWTLLGSSVIRLPFIVKTSLGHEVAHNWWGNGVLVDPSQGNWSEGLTTYLADHLYKELDSPVAAREYRLKALRDYSSLVGEDNAFPLQLFRSRYDKASQAIGYGKAMMLFHMLRQEVGDELFWKVLHRVALEQLGERISWRDWSRIFSRASGENLGPWFRQWLQRTGAPRLRLSAIEKRQTAQGWQVSGQIIQQDPAYQMSLKLRLVCLETTSEERLQLTGIKTDFILTCQGRPESLKADPEVDLFRRLTPEELPATVNDLRAARELEVIRGQGVEEGLADRLLQAFRKSRVKPIKLNRLKALPSTADLLLIGDLPPNLRPELPAGFTVEPGTLTVDGKRYPRAGMSLFLALVPAGQVDRRIFWFIPGPFESALKVARKLPHYGKYGYLLFKRGKNRAKGTAQPAFSPMMVDLVGDPE